jgi:phytoene/squalene synthetase
MEYEINRAKDLLQSGAPLGLVLPGRIGLEMRTIIAGGERILNKLSKSHGDMFHHRPALKLWDWAMMIYKAVLKQ